MNINVVGKIDQLSGYKMRPSNPAIDAFYMKTLGMKLNIGPNPNTGVYYDVALVTILYDMLTIYQAHLNDFGVVGKPHTAKNAADDMVPVPATLDVINYFAGEYAKYLGVPNLALWNARQTERNEPWSDVENLLAFLFNLTNVLNAFKASFDHHCSIHATLGVANDPDNVLTAVPDIVIPVPDGIVPSLKYNDGYTKYLVEIERTYPSFIKGRIGEWIKNICLMIQAVVPRYTNHAQDLTDTYHVVPDTVNVLQTPPITRL